MRVDAAWIGTGEELVLATIIDEGHWRHHEARAQSLLCGLTTYDWPLVDAVNRWQALCNGFLIINVGARQVGERAQPVRKLDQGVGRVAAHFGGKKSARHERVDADATLKLRGLAAAQGQVVPGAPELVPSR